MLVEVENLELQEYMFDRPYAHRVSWERSPGEQVTLAASKAG